MIRNAVIHLANEQPLLADLFAPPGAADISLVCTNLRGMNGKRPVFADHDDSLFVFPYAHIRFVEVPAAALAAADAWLPAGAGSAGPTDGNGSNGSIGPAAGDLAAAIVAGMAAAAPAPPPPEAVADEPAEPAAPEAPADDLDQELELDEDFLRRVREL